MTDLPEFHVTMDLVFEGGEKDFETLRTEGNDAEGFGETGRQTKGKKKTKRAKRRRSTFRSSAFARSRSKDVAGDGDLDGEPEDAAAETMRSARSFGDTLGVGTRKARKSRGTSRKKKKGKVAEDNENDEMMQNQVNFRPTNTNFNMDAELLGNQSPNPFGATGRSRSKSRGTKRKRRRSKRGNGTTTSQGSEEGADGEA